VEEVPVPDDPFPARRRGYRRTRTVTVTLGAVGAVVTGAVAGLVAHGGTATASTPTAGGTPDGGSSSGTAPDGGSSAGDLGQGSASGGFSVPGTLPGSGPGGSAGGHASSGGS
jgi:hypothetical protein